MLDSRAIRHFLAVAEHKSFVRAAAQTHLTQPALSKSIRALETSLGVRLFERSGHGTSLTLAGEVMLKHAKLIVAETKHMIEAIADARRGVHSQIVVGCAPTITQTLMPVATLRFVKRLPGVKLQICSGLNDELIASLRRGDLDVVFGALPQQRSDEFVTEVLYVDPVTVVTRRDHPLARKRKVQLKDLLPFPWVLFGPRVYGQDRFNAPFVEAGLVTPTVQVESNSAAFNKYLVMNGDYLSYLPFELIEDELRSGAIAALDVDGVNWPRNVGITYRRRGSMSQAATTFIEEVRRLVRSQAFGAGPPRTARRRTTRATAESGATAGADGPRPSNARRRLAAA